MSDDVEGLKHLIDKKVKIYKPYASNKSYVGTVAGIYKDTANQMRVMVRTPDGKINHENVGNISEILT